MKTPITEVIEILNERNADGELEYSLYSYIYEELINLLEKEKQMIVDSFVEGFKDCEEIHEEAFAIQDNAEQYYNETFKND